MSLRHAICTQHNDIDSLEWIGVCAGHTLNAILPLGTWIFCHVKLLDPWAEPGRYFRVPKKTQPDSDSSKHLVIRLIPQECEFLDQLLLLWCFKKKYTPLFRFANSQKVVNLLNEKDKISFMKTTALSNVKIHSPRRFEAWDPLKSRCKTLRISRPGLIYLLQMQQFTNRADGVKLSSPWHMFGPECIIGMIKQNVERLDKF